MYRLSINWTPYNGLICQSTTLVPLVPFCHATQLPNPGTDFFVSQSPSGRRNRCWFIRSSDIAINRSATSVGIPDSGLAMSLLFWCWQCIKSDGQARLCLANLEIQPGKLLEINQIMAYYSISVQFINLSHKTKKTTIWRCHYHEPILKHDLTSKSRHWFLHQSEPYPGGGWDVHWRAAAMTPPLPVFLILVLQCPSCFSAGNVLTFMDIPGFVLLAMGSDMASCSRSTNLKSSMSPSKRI